MRTTSSVQIGFKVTPEVAAKLDAISQTPGRFHRLSRSLIAKELVLSALASDVAPISMTFDRTLPAEEAGPLLEVENDQTEAADIMQDLLATVEVQNRFLSEFRQVLDQLTLLRRRDLPNIREDIRVAAAAILRQGGASIEEIRNWIADNLGEVIPEGEEDAQHSPDSRR